MSRWPFKPTTLFTLTLLIGGIGLPFMGMTASLTVEAEHDLGVQYLKGEGVPLDKVRGRTYIQQSARRDYPLAQFHLGLLFYRGEGGDKSLSCAEYWFNKAAKSDSDAGRLANDALAELASQLTLPPDRRFLLSGVTNERQCTQLPGEIVTSAVPQQVARLEQAPERPQVNESRSISAITSPAPHQLPDEQHAARPLNVMSHFLTLPRSAFTQMRHVTDNLSVQWQQAYIAYSLQRSIGAREDRHHQGRPLLSDTPRYIAQHSRRTPTINKTQNIHSSQPPSAQAEIAVSSLRVPSKGIPDKSHTKPPSHNLGGVLTQASPQHYTLQVSSASHPAGLHETARRFRLSNYLVYQTVRHGREWHVLIYGEYADKATANRALKDLPLGLQQNQPWVRSLKQVQAELAK